MQECLSFHARWSRCCSVAGDFVGHLRWSWLCLLREKLEAAERQREEENKALPDPIVLATEQQGRGFQELLAKKASLIVRRVPQNGVASYWLGLMFLLVFSCRDCCRLLLSVVASRRVALAVRTTCFLRTHVRTQWSLG